MGYLKVSKTSRELIIQSQDSFLNYWQELWQFRELFYVLARRDISVRYKQTVIGVAWAILQPILTLIVFTVVFNKIVKLQAPTAIPYGLMVYVALIPWQFFSTSLTSVSSSLIDNSNLIGKVYFPRLIIPIASISVSVVDLIINICVLAFLLIWYKFIPSWEILLLPAMVLMAFLAIIGPGLWISSINVKYRDFRYVIPFLIQLGLYASPVGYSSEIIPEKWRLIYFLNPMAGVIEGFRWSILSPETGFYYPGFCLSNAIIMIMLIFGISQFRRSEKSFADNL